MKRDLGNGWFLISYLEPITSSPLWHVRGIGCNLCQRVVGLKFPDGDWPLDDAGKRRFRKELTAAMNEMGDFIWDRCEKAE